MVGSKALTKSLELFEADPWDWLESMVNSTRSLGRWPLRDDSVQSQRRTAWGGPPNNDATRREAKLRQCRPARMKLYARSSAGFE
jgi:hypothetical protein